VHSEGKRTLRNDAKAMLNDSISLIYTDEKSFMFRGKMGFSICEILCDLQREGFAMPFFRVCLDSHRPATGEDPGTA